jgi:hypothetical protein
MLSISSFDHYRDVFVVDMSALYASQTPPLKLNPFLGTGGKLEKEFEVLDGIGTGEFGDVMKVRPRGSCATTCLESNEFALKRTRRFEGQKRR